MAYSRLLITLAFVVCAFGALRSVNEVRDTVTVSDVQQGHLRAFTAELDPTAQHPKNIQLTGIQIDLDGGNTTTAELDAVQFTLNTTNQATLSLAFLKAHGDTNNLGNLSLDTSVQAFLFILRAFGVFEFVDRNGIPGFQNNTADLITGIYDLSSPHLEWKDLVIVSDEINVNGTDVKIFYVTAETMDEVFLVRFVVLGATAEVEGVKINSESCKVDVAVRWFTSNHTKANWTTGPSNAELFPNATVGVLAAFAAAAESFTQTADNAALNSSNPTLNFVAANATGFFSYETSADVTVQGVTAAEAVHADYSDRISHTNNAFNADFLVRIFWFSFGGSRPSYVAWDPEFGATPSSSTPAETSSNPSTSGSTTSASTTGSGSHSTGSGVAVVPTLFTIVFAMFVLVF